MVWFVGLGGGGLDGSKSLIYVEPLAEELHHTGISHRGILRSSHGAQREEVRRTLTNWNASYVVSSEKKV